MLIFFLTLEIRIQAQGLYVQPGGKGREWRRRVGGNDSSRFYTSVEDLLSCLRT